MDEYISREEAIEAIRYRVCQGHGNKEHICKRGSCAYCGIMEIMNDISSIEAADVQSVKHGRWEYEHTIAEMKHYCCTNCKNSGNECIADENEILWWNFCPRCGCKIDFGDDSDD